MTDGFPDFVWRTLAAEAVLAPDRALALDIESNDSGADEVARVPRHAADRSGLSVVVEEGHISFRRAVELYDLGNREARAESLPNVGPESIADDGA